MRDTRYSRFIHGLQQAGILLNRKMLSQIAIEDPKLFDQLVQIAEAKLAAASTTAPARKTRSKPEPKPKPEPKAKAEPKPKAEPQPQPDAARST